MNSMSLSDLLGVGIALAAGLLIGLERGWHQRDIPDGHRVAGLRTFALIGLLGGLSGLLAQRWGAVLLVVVLAAVALLVLAGYIVTARMHSVMGLTTAMAAITTFLVGVLAAGGSTLLASAVAVVTVALLQLKRPMHSGIGKLTESELTSGIQLLLISVVILPVLPDRGFGPFEALNPYKLWWAVVLLALLSFLGFVLMRWFGARRGLTLTALLGGLVSSTAQCERARPRCSDCSCAASPAVGHRPTRATAVAGEPAERLAELAEPPVRRGDGCTVAALCGVDETASGCRIRPSGGFVDRSCSRGRLQRLGTSVAFIPRQLRDRTVFADRAAGSDLGLFRQGLTGHVVGLDASRHEVPDRSCDGGRLVFGHERA